MRISQLFPKKYANGEDLAGKTPTLTISAVTLETMHLPGAPAEEKPVIWFNTATKGIILTPTLARQIAEIHGDDTDTWTGRKIQLYTLAMTVAGKPRQSIRARRAPNGETPPPAAMQQEDDD
jgi:hypothetical protein